MLKRHLATATAFSLGLNALMAPIAFAENILPHPPPVFKGKIELRAKDSTPDFPKPLTAKPGSPNVLMILIDDEGFGASSAFGGPVSTPNLDKLKAEGVAYNQFHTTALSSPTRAALITGRNHHSVHTGVITEAATGFPGYDTLMNFETATIGEILKDNGYSTAWFGKNHNVPDWQTSQAGPFDLWPTSLGFEHFYGFLGGETNQWTPILFNGTVPIEPYMGNPDYHLTTDLADQAIAHIQLQQALDPSKPFLVYFAPGATHAPHHAPPEWIAKFKGQFDHGWDKQREITFVKQKEMGIIPADAVLTPRPSQIQAWDSATPEQQKMYAHMMEVYAGFLAHTDYNVGRVLDQLEKSGVKDNTLVIHISGDNGASGEGTLQGSFNEANFFNGIPEPQALLEKYIDRWGSNYTYPHYPVGWAWAMDTPFQWVKQVASHYGGTRNGLVISWPAKIKDVGTIRSQWHHVIDIVPTILEAAGIPQPDIVNGVKQKPIEGVSMVYTFNDAKALSRHTTQYFEMLGNRGIYHEGWVACTTPASLPWEIGSSKTDPEVISGYKWELYHVDMDFSEAVNMADKYPEKLKELQNLFYAEAKKYNVLPMDNSKFARLNPMIRPSLTRGRDTFTYYAGMNRIPNGASPDVLNRSFSITADVVIPQNGGNGMLITQGGRFGGYGLYMLNGKLVYTFNMDGIYSADIVSTDNVPAGRHTVTMDFKYNGGGIAKGGTATLLVDGAQVGQGIVALTTPVTIALDSTLDIGMDTGTGISETYTVPFRFNGTLEQVTIKLQPIDPVAEEELGIVKPAAEMKKKISD